MSYNKIITTNFNNKEKIVILQLRTKLLFLMQSIKILKNTTLLAFTIFNTYSAFSQQVIIQTGNIWKYFDQGNHNEPTWKNSSFDDSTWPSGISELGYGDGDEATVVGYGPSATNKHIATYFRKSFELESQRGLNCTIKIDDGAAVYLNGVEVYRNNLPGGTISFSTLALNANNENAWSSFTIPLNLTQSGVNVIAIEMHQASKESSDLSFDFSLTSLSPPPPLGIYLNEVMSSNTNTIEDNEGNTSDWFEIFNNTSTGLDLANYYVSDDAGNIKKFRFSSIPGQIVVPPFGYKIIWASGTISSGSNHTSWSLSANGEYLSLVAPDGVTIIDDINIPKLKSDISFGRLYSHIDSLVYFNPTSPGVENLSTNAYLGYLEPPVFSHNGGFYDQNFNLSLISTVPHAKILYSLDGSTPDSNNITTQYFPYKNNFPGLTLYQGYRSFNYLNSLQISDRTSQANSVSQKASKAMNNPNYFPNYLLKKGTVVRAVNSLPGFIESEAVTQTYFILPKNQYTLPVISVSIPEKDLFDYNQGFYTPGYYYESANPQNQFCPIGNYTQDGELWEKKGTFEFFDEGELKINTNVTFKIHGRCSVQNALKSLRVHSKNIIDYPFFPNLPNNRYETILLRNGGNETEISMIRDLFYHDVVKDLNFGYQDSKPCVSFLNGEYWGILNIRERIDEDYLGVRFKVDKDSVDMVHISGGSTDLENGTLSNYEELHDFIESSDLTNNSNYNVLKTKIDIENFIDYYIVQIFAANTDFPASNVRLWRSNASIDPGNIFKDGKWRYLLFDLDWSLGFPVSSNFNSLDLLTDPNNEHNLFFRKIHTNNEFRNLFLNRFADLLNSHLSLSRTTEILTSLKNELLPEMSEHTARWKAPNDVTSWENNVSSISNFLNQRHAFQNNHLLSKFGLSGTFLLTVNSPDLSKGYIKVNTININSETPGIPENSNSWTGKYFDQVSTTLIAKPKIGYRFSHWIYNGQTIMDSILTFQTSSNRTYTAYFEKRIISDNPTPQAFDLNTCSYEFSNWPSNSPAGSYPKNIKFVSFDTEDPTLTSNIVSITTGVYNFNSRTRINGLGSLGFSFINTTGSNSNLGYPTGRLGGAILALNTIGLDTIKLSWKARTITPGGRKYGLRLQYREGDIWPFQDFNPPIEYLGSTLSGDSALFELNNLPVEIQNKPYVQLLWRYYYRGSGSGSRDQLAIDEIHLKGIKVHNDLKSNVSETHENPSIYNLTSKIIGNSSIKYQASNAILILPNFSAENGVIFEAKINGCQ